MIISHNSVSMDLIKLKGIKDWPTPTTVKQVRLFLGFGNYYRRFIQKFLNNLLKKDTKFKWNSECQIAINLLKWKFSKEPVLMMLDPTRPFQIKTNASKYASGAVLMQLDSNGSQHPIAFLSKTFSETKRNYDVYDRELSAIIRALTEWRHYMQGSTHTTTVFSDHKNLTYFRSAQNLNWQQAQWSLFLLEYDIKLHHIPGIKMQQADTLSRQSWQWTNNSAVERPICKLTGHRIARMDFEGHRPGFWHCKCPWGIITGKTVNIDQRPRQLECGRIGQRKGNILQRKELCAKEQGSEKRHCKNIPWPWDGRTPWRIGDIQFSKGTLLVARTKDICERMCKGMCSVSTVQDWPSSITPGISTHWGESFN